METEKKEIVHLLKTTVLMKREQATTKYIEKYYDSNGELLFIKEVDIPNNPIFTTNITIKKD